jgi:hypothetical protein
MVSPYILLFYFSSYQNMASVSSVPQLIASCPPLPNLVLYHFIHSTPTFEEDSTDACSMMPL